MQQHRSQMGILRPQRNLVAVDPLPFVGGIGLLVLGLLFILWWGDWLSFMHYLFPVASVLLGGLFYVAYPGVYIGFTWWIWFLSPFIRRVVDYETVWTDPSFILLTPYLVTTFTVITFWQNLGRLREHRFMPFTLVLLGISMGYAVAIASNGLFVATYGLLQWVLPILFGFHVYILWPHYPKFRLVTQRVFKWGILIIGTYALIQFFLLPPWDEYWMLNVGMNSIGKPRPFEVRIFSMLNAPAPFGHIMVAGLLLLFSQRSLTGLMANVPGYAGLLLSLSRSSWGAWVIGLGLITLRSSGKLRGRLLLLLGASTLIILPVITTDVVYDRLARRFGTFTNLEEDASLQSRLYLYAGVPQYVLRTPLGFGIGSTGTAQKASDRGTSRNFDSGLLDIPLSLGWLGGLLYFLGLGQLVRRNWKSRVPGDAFNDITNGVVLAILALLVFGKVHTGVSGIELWFFIGITGAGILHHKASTEGGGSVSASSSYG